MKFARYRRDFATTDGLVRLVELLIASSEGRRSEQRYTVNVLR